MSSFNDLFSAFGAPVLKQHFGASVTYYPLDGVAREVAGIVQDEAQQRQHETHHEHEELTLKFICSRDPETGIAAPQQGDAIRLATEPAETRWQFRAIVDLDANWQTLEFVRHAALYAGYRRPASM